MTAKVFCLLVPVLLALPVSTWAQEATLTGSVVDTTGAALPGVTVTAQHTTSGNTFTGLTDDRGNYRIAVRVGVYKVTAELQGFTTLSTDNVEVLVGQQLVANIRMAPSNIQESVTVTAEAPLIDTTQSKLGGNVDARQLQELPVNGRNWMDLTLLAPGSRVNAVTADAPTSQGGTLEQAFQFNVDGQQVTSTIAGASGGWGQPRFSRDAIGEFEFISNRFDATQGRSSGVQINAVTKSGTNVYAGSVAGYFRDDNFNAKDFIVDRVLKYSNKQFSTTFGGPIQRDRMHFFAHWEHEREPQSFTYTSPYPRFNIADLSAMKTESKGGVRLDSQLASGSHLMVRGNGFRNWLPYDPRTAGGATLHPSQTNNTRRWSGQAFASLTQTLGARAINELKGGWSRLNAYSDSNVPSPQIALRGYTLGAQIHYPLLLDQETYSIRENVTMQWNDHELKIGGEYLHMVTSLDWLARRYGAIDATGGPVPANIQDLFPVWNDPRTWNINALAPLVVRVQQTVGDSTFSDPRHTSAAWIQDNWTVTSRFTLNLGLRWDASIGSLAEEVEILPFKTKRDSELTNFGPRVGFVYSLNDQTALRGGVGKYYGDTTDQLTHFGQGTVHGAALEILNDGRADFPTNWHNGPVPTYEQVVNSGRRREAIAPVPSSAVSTPYSYQTSVGMQRQVGRDIAVEADYVYSGNRNQQYTIPNINVSYNPATGLPNPFSNVATRPFSNWGVVQLLTSNAYSNYHGLQTALTKRFSQRWQASATYTLAALRDGTPQPIFPGCQYPISGPSPTACTTAFEVVSDLGTNYGFAVGDQRHRAVFNGIWELPYDFQISGLYFYASGERFATTLSGDTRGNGATVGNRFRATATSVGAAGTVIPRNDFVGEPLHRVDMRLTRRFSVGRVRADGILEVFNAFNHANYGSYVTNESSPAYGRPAQNVNLAYAPRMLQLGFRVTF